MANNDRVYEAYSGEMGENFQIATKNRIDWIVEHVEEKEYVLDAGCSQGIVALLLASSGKEVVGIDIQPEAVAYANQLLETKYKACKDKVSFICSDILEVEPEKKFDCIIFTEIIEHLENPDAVLDKLESMLSENGRMIISTPFGVCEHPDHKATYYLTNFLRVLSGHFSVCNIEFVEQWMGAICKKKSSKDGFETTTLAFQEQQEKAFERRERQYLSEIVQIKESNHLLNEKYKTALKNYDTAKQWLENNTKKYDTELKKREEKLIECLNSYDNQMHCLNKIQNRVAQLERQNEVLLKENSAIRWKLDRIKNSLIGKVGIKLYRVYKKCKGKG